MTETCIPDDFYEKFPESVVKNKLLRIWGKIFESWGSEECAQYLESLYIVEDDRTRQGFNSEIMSELLLLGKLHEQEHPEFAVTKLGGGFRFVGHREGSADI